MDILDSNNQKNNYSIIRHRLNAWYEANKRILPWRMTHNPYLIWVSEIILQQTRVEQGIDYYFRFTEKFPDISSLAAADEDQVLKIWQGLGYYSRARNMQKAAKQIMSKFRGSFPDSFDDIHSLCGIGDYTTAAIASIAWNKPFAVVDGNVFRVLSRLFTIDTPIDNEIGKKEFVQLANKLLDQENPGLHNQAMMELGALQCVPKNPNCIKCPLNDLCKAKASESINLYPAKVHKTATRDRFFSYIYIKCINGTFLHRRESKDIWQGLYEFPLIETSSPCKFDELRQTDAFRQIFKEAGKTVLIQKPFETKHQLTHQTIYATFYSVTTERETSLSHQYLPANFEELSKYPFPKLILKFFDWNKKNSD